MNTQLKSYALDINDILSEYIAIHNTLISKTNSIFSIFKPINFGELRDNTESISSKLKDKIDEISQIDSTDDKEKEFLNCLIEYSQSLLNTNQLLHKELDDLFNKSQGGKLSLKEHLDNNKAYKESIEKYRKLGDKLNTLYKEL